MMPNEMFNLTQTDHNHPHTGNNMELSLSVITRMQDNGDGGYTTYCYNSEDELIQDHPISHAGKMTPEKREEILQGDDEYENGYIGSETIHIKIVDNVPMLARPFSIHSGQ